VLSGLLSGPYGLSNRLHNIDSAALAGALVVFDEFHLMEPQRAFLTRSPAPPLREPLSDRVDDRHGDRAARNGSARSLAG